MGKKGLTFVGCLIMVMSALGLFVDPAFTLENYNLPTVPLAFAFTGGVGFGLLVAAMLGKG